MNNQYGSTCFYVSSHSANITTPFSFDWECSPQKIAYGQMLFVNSKYVNGFADNKNRIVVSRITNAQNNKDYIQSICEYWQRYHPEIALWDWSRKQITEFVRAQMTKPVSSVEVAPLYASHKLKTLSMFINQSRNQHTEGTLPDGFQYSLNNSFKRSIMEPLLNERGMTYEEWEEGDSYGMIPLPIASIMLSDAIRLIESEDAKAAKVFFSVWRRHKPHPSNCFKKQSGSKLDRLQRYFRDKDTDKLSAVDKDMGESFSEAGLAHLNKLPWSSVGELSEWCKDLMKASLTILLIISGFRISEVASLRFCDYEKISGEWVFKSSVFKTHEGFRVPRVLHDLTALAAHCLEGISYIDTTKFEMSFFHRGFMEGAASSALNKVSDIRDWVTNHSRIALKTMAPWINDFYHKFTLKRYPELENECATLSAHQCRHTWAAFALRRMDGNVEERIREHFLHSRGSSMTKAYTKLKLNEAVRNSQEDDYLKEIIKRISKKDIEDQFIGPAARRILKSIGEIETLTIEELNEKIESFAASIGRLSATEWGFCVFFYGSEQSAKCYDPVSRLPDIDGGSGPTICCGCPNGMHNKLHAENLTRIGIQHQYISDTHPIRAIGKLSSDIVKSITKRLEEK
ncbi:site-specific integrase [Pseudomonas sp. CFBP 13719]|uniref:site-specific integrase n=1 Tax=Pseudomonas sp. CFBP 13719 TaxID=2775303 RepID=UPI001781410F|nr:site-specific integrase [Pseudomonas sp. CFBP 13719]MBD8682395.1 hypothetical protein [Pseudomonas sp. CFBP 13719]